MQEGNKEKLSGLLMVDRPRPVNPAWLREVEATYGGHQLIPMTNSGERGIACQMRIEPESQDHLQRFPSAQSTAITKALEPFLEEPPDPVFNMWWDKDVQLWRSLMTAQMALPLEIRQVFEQTGYGCLAAESSRGIIHVCHAPDKDIDSFPHHPVTYCWQLIRMPTAPLIRLELLILDNPANPYRFESFLNIAAADQARTLYELASQEKLYLAFYGDQLDYRYTKEVEHDEQQWQKIDEMAIRAIDHWLAIPQEQRNFDRAKAEFMKRFP
jgi:hypothetical protein